MSRAFPGFEEVEPGRKSYKRASEWCQDLECIDLFLLWNHSFTSCKYKLHPFQDLTDSIFCSHFPVLVVGFFNNSIKEPFLWQSRQRLQKCHGKALQFHAYFFYLFFFKETARGDQRPAVYIQSILASFFSTFHIFSVSFSCSLSIFTLPHQRAIRTKTLSSDTVYNWYIRLASYKCKTQ